MRTFYEAFREHLARRHPVHSTLLKRLEDGQSGSPHDLETLLAALQLAQSAPASLKVLGVAVDTLDLATGELADLRGFLDAFIVDTCERFDRDRSASEFAPILKLRALAPLWIFTTNYDRIVEQACERHEIAYSDGFEAGSGNPVADYSGVFDKDVRVVKLHGSVNWYQNDPDEKLHRLDRGYSLPTKDFALVRGGQRLRPLMIIPTLEKQVMDRPYAQLLVRLTDVLRGLPLLVVAGNSLRDKHLLNYISDRLPRLQVLLVSPNASQNLQRLGLGDGACALDIGFRELLLGVGDSLDTLARTVQGVETPDAVAAAVQVFIGEVQANAAADLAMRGSPELEIYARLLKDQSAAQRARAATALGGHAHPGVVHRLKEVLRQDTSEHVRAAAVGALIRVGTAAAIAEALSGLKDASSVVQLEAVTGLLSRPQSATTTEALEGARGTLSRAAVQILDDAQLQGGDEPTRS